jgi:Icc-related predicted phosphoesterase
MKQIKIVSISDIHGFLDFNLPKGDILCICGDILPLEVQKDYIKSTVWMCNQFLPWTQILPYKYIVFIGGNHDFLFEKLGSDLMDIIDPNRDYMNVFYLQNNFVILENIKIYGSPYIKDLKNWAFYKKDNELLKEFKKIPNDVDILLTHIPPRVNMCGAVLQSNAFNYLSDFGSEELADVLLTKPNIKYHLFGHVHSGDHNITKNANDTCLVNVSIKDEDYKLSYNPLIINYESKTN